MRISPVHHILELCDITVAACTHGRAGSCPDTILYTGYGLEVPIYSTIFMSRDEMKMLRIPQDTHAYQGSCSDVLEPSTHGQDVTHGWRSDTLDTTPDKQPFLRV